VAVVVGVFAVVVPGLAPYADIADAIGAMSSRSRASIAVLAVLNLGAPALAQSVALPGLSVARAAASDWASTAVSNLVPGGTVPSMAVTWTMYRSWDLDEGGIARAMIATGVVDNLVKFVIPLPAALWLARERPVDASLGTAAATGAVLFILGVALVGVVVGSPGIARRLGAWLDTFARLGGAWEERLVQWRAATVELARRRGAALGVVTCLGHLNLFLLLLACVRGVGVGPDQIGTAGVLAAFAFGRLITAVPLTPGGLGVAELGLIGTLDLVGGAETALVVSAVLLFRFLTFAIPVPLGGLTWAAWSLRR